ncbi:MarR family winged helix-turn-helix transcriptional regulator [Bradyrhizobium sp. CCBAU 53338]|uniref:MarR family winged helix-turn-helix transcriptional regulator n=1 Tax=Bradyrhizobium sp. CCBAU 53338 TaxID=1325111 RepID=UPI00188CB1FA|nr:MarR family transcriptional regulator [Bradyrhizobium sp. CCBAU 53338]QOZ52560.1 MarR family transcriptional regulator [Bradyrhizobium sp. CCBAU 53338]
MNERFYGNIMQDGSDQEAPRPTLGEIGINHFAPYLINRIAARYNANMAEALKALGITTTDMRVLAILSLNSSITINELAVYTVTQQSTMSRTLDELEEQGLIRRIARPDDRRIRDVSITKKGRQAFEKIWPILYEQFRQLFDGVQEEEYRSFVNTLHQVLRNIRKHEI